MYFYKICPNIEIFKLGVISTIHVGDGCPESAVVGFSETEGLKIIFGTSNTSRKYKNLQSNNHVSFVIGWDSKTGTVQYEGIAKEASLEEALEYAKIIVAKNPVAEKFVNRKDQRYFIVTPKWIRFSDNAGSSPGIYEVSFVND